MSSSEISKCDRHCAYCLKMLPAGTAKLCGKCHRRAYCSRDCQKADWSQKLGSQGHKNWFGLPCGEEDIDWEVKSVPGKGLGIIAKRLIPINYRIMVEAVREENHPAINDLMPISGTIQDKIYLNVFACEFHDDPGAICLRLSRVNHSCKPNACKHNDPVHGVLLLCAERDIQPGEEITICYTSFNDISVHESAMEAKMALLMKWGIVCEAGCICRDENVRRLIEETRALNGNHQEGIMKTASRGDTDKAMKMIKKIMENHNKIYSLSAKRVTTLFDGFQVGITCKSTMNKAMEYIGHAYEIRAAQFHPKSEEVRALKGFFDDPSRHGNYMCFERK